MKSTFEKMGGTYTPGADGIYYPNLVSTDEDYDTLRRIADYFGVSIDYLLGHETPAVDDERQLLTCYRSFSDALVAACGKYNLEHCNTITNSAPLKSAMFLDHRKIFQGSLDSFFLLFRALWNSCIF